MSIVINNSKNVFLLQTVSNSYAFGIDDQGLVRHLYWGKRIEAVEDFEMPVLTEVSTNDPVYEITPEEFPVYGSLRYKEHCLKVTFADGTRDPIQGRRRSRAASNRLLLANLPPARSSAYSGDTASTSC